MIDCTEAMAILKEFDVEVIPSNGHPRPGQTKALRSLQKIVKARGFEHARFVVMLWKETNLRAVVMEAVALWAISDIVVAIETNYPEITRSGNEKLFAFMDSLALGWIMEWSRSAESVIPRRCAIAGMIWERVIRVFDMPQADLWDDRVHRLACALNQ